MRKKSTRSVNIILGVYGLDQGLDRFHIQLNHIYIFGTRVHFFQEKIGLDLSLNRIFLI